jgi:protein ImuA
VIQANTHIISDLRADILRLEGFRPAGNSNVDTGLGAIVRAFPNSTFPVGAVHEFLSTAKEDMAATTGFISSLLATLMGNKGTAIWISTSRTLFPPALKVFGIEPDRIIFIDLKKENDVLWAMDESLKCGALTAVVGEMQNISFTESRRLQLSVEQSQVTGFILRKRSKNIGTTACVSRWRISSLPCDTYDDLPGIGFPKWKVELLRMRNGKPGMWDVNCMNGRFSVIEKLPMETVHERRKAG